MSWLVFSLRRSLWAGSGREVSPNLPHVDQWASDIAHFDAIVNQRLLMPMPRLISDRQWDGPRAKQSAGFINIIAIPNRYCKH